MDVARVTIDRVAHDRRDYLGNRRIFFDRLRVGNLFPERFDLFRFRFSGVLRFGNGRFELTECLPHFAREPLIETDDRVEVSVGNQEEFVRDVRFRCDEVECFDRFKVVRVGGSYLQNAVDYRERHEMVVPC